RCETSVQNAENGALVRKSARVQGTKLPYKMLKTGPWYGSQQGNRDKNFRTKCGKQASGTEVCRCTRHETSVKNAENGHLGRKFAWAQGTKLPSQTLKTGLRDGSRQAHME
ncbi:MAG: hypothetical protein IKF90_06335, partial [Parasporobacterium sp.]|nr:hypothetical protein [Parasporobacterium sp.]